MEASLPAMKARGFSGLPRSLGAAIVVVVVVVASISLITVNARADSPTTEECVAANESAQVLRRSEKFRAARAQLLVCISKGCPAVVREDCGVQLSELDRSSPTVVFVIKDAGGRDINADLRIDGRHLADQRGVNTPLIVDPGVHTFTFSAPRYLTFTTTFTIPPASNTRREVVLEPLPSSIAATTIPTTQASPSIAQPVDHPAADEKRAKAQNQTPLKSNEQQNRLTPRTAAYVVGGAGGVGVAVGALFGVLALTNHNDAKTRCPNSACPSVDGVDSEKRAGVFADASTIAFVGGAALLVGGFVLFVMTPNEPAVTVSVKGSSIRIGREW